MKNVKKKFKFLTFLLALIMLVGTAFPASAATNSTISAATVQSGQQFSLVGMPYNGKYSPLANTYNGASFTVRSVQNFSYTPDGKYIFTVSEGYSGSESDGVKHTILTRCIVPQETGALAQATCEQATILDNYGHGEAIAITQSDLNTECYDIWVACTPNKCKKERYGTEIARLTYVVTDGVGEITKRVILSNFVKTNVEYKNKKSVAKYQLDDKKKKATIFRTNVSADVNDNRIAFRISFSGGGTNYIIYDYQKLNTALDKVENNKKYNMSKAASYQKANVGSYLVPYDTFQSFAIDDKYIYICGGHMDKGAAIYKMPYKTYANGKTKEQVITSKKKFKQTIKITPELNVNGKTLGKSDLEIEGMKIQKNANGKIDYYVNFYMKDTPIGDNIGIYKFTK